jgi:hypothetical protein
MFETYLAVQNIMVAITLDRHLDVRSITRRNLRLRHQEGRANLALQQRIEPLPLLLFSSVLGNNLHIARVGSSAVHGLGSRPALAEVLSHESVLEIAEASTLLEVCLGQEHVP